MPFKREEARERCLRLFNEIDRKGGRASKWDLTVVAGGTEDQFRIWITGFLFRYKFIKPVHEGQHIYYSKTANGEQFHALLKNWNIFGTALQRITGKKLKRETEVDR